MKLSGSFSHKAMTVIVIYFSYFFLNTSALEETSNLETLRLVQVIFRHGDRNPSKTFPTDYYKNTSVYWPEGLGQLTNTGKMEQYNLGRYLRHRYDNFISPNYIKGEIQVVSSDMDRTIMSAEANLAGFYQPINSTLNWNPNLPWTPVPFRTIPKYEDKYFQMKKPCSRYSMLRTDFLSSGAYQEILESIKLVSDTVIEESGLPKDASLTDLVDVFDILFVQAKHNLTPPAWAEGKVLTEFHSITGLYLGLKSYTPEMARLRVGPFVKLLLENIDRNVNSSIQVLQASQNGDDDVVKMFMYSGHDQNIAEILTALGMYNQVQPPYASALMIELHKDEQYDDFHLNILYRNDTSHPAYLLEVSSCGTPCFINTFRKLTESIVPGNWEEECEDLTKISGPESNLNILCYIFGITIACLIIAAFVLCICCKVKESDIFRKHYQAYSGYDSLN